MGGAAQQDLGLPPPNSDAPGGGGLAVSPAELELVETPPPIRNAWIDSGGRRRRKWGKSVRDSSVNADMVNLDPEGVVAPPKVSKPSPIGAGGERYPKGPEAPPKGLEGPTFLNSAPDAGLPAGYINAPVKYSLDIKHKRINHTGCRFLNSSKKGKKFLGGKIRWKS